MTKTQEMLATMWFQMHERKLKAKLHLSEAKHGLHNKL